MYSKPVRSENVRRVVVRKEVFVANSGRLQFAERPIRVTDAVNCRAQMQMARGIDQKLAKLSLALVVAPNCRSRPDRLRAGPLVADRTRAVSAAS